MSSFENTCFRFLPLGTVKRARRTRTGVCVVCVCVRCSVVGIFKYYYLLVNILFYLSLRISLMTCIYSVTCICVHTFITEMLLRYYSHKHLENHVVRFKPEWLGIMLFCVAFFFCFFFPLPFFVEPIRYIPGGRRRDVVAMHGVFSRAHHVDIITLDSINKRF